MGKRTRKERGSALSRKQRNRTVKLMKLLATAALLLDAILKVIERVARIVRWN